MHYENELRFFCDILKKCRIKVSFIKGKDLADKLFNSAFESLFRCDERKNLISADFGEKIAPYTIYKLTTSFKFCFIFLLLPQSPANQVMLIGPYLSENIGEKSLLEFGEIYGISPQKQKMLAEYFSSLPVITENSQVLLMVDTFAEHIWGGNSGYDVIDINRELITDASPLSKDRSGEEVGNLITNMELMQKRYDFENELIRAVSLGLEHKVSQLMEAFTDMSFEQRITDQVRNLKNYAIIMNTLLRKAAESGGVHPLYINDVSTNFAIRIEQTTSTKQIINLMSEMYKTYCRLVKKHSMNKYSPAVQKAVALINSDLSANLTLHSLSASLNISDGYLSSVFRKETGVTLTQYILNERIQLAMRLLSTTNLQVQSIAQHCGILDVHYFSKLFKKQNGITPKQYREMNRLI